MYNVNKDLVIQEPIESIASGQRKSNNSPIWKKCSLEKSVISVDYKVYASKEIQIENHPISFECHEKQSLIRIAKSYEGWD